jgi:hypothetical protein
MRSCLASSNDFHKQTTELPRYLQNSHMLDFFANLLISNYRNMVDPVWALLYPCSQYQVHFALA